MKEGIDLLTWIKSLGYNFHPILDGKTHRFIPPGKKNPDGWYIGSRVGEFQSCTIGDWSLGEKWSWHNANGDYEKHKVDIESLAKAVAQEENERHEEAKKAGQILWNASHLLLEAGDISPWPYLAKKKIKPYGGIRIFPKDESIIIPVCDVGPGNTMWGAQKIYPDGTKMFLKHQKCKGLAFTIPGNEISAICEGYATGSTIHELTGATVHVAFYADNLLPVYESLRKVDQGIPKSYWIFADNDCWKKDNTGKTKAQALLQAYPDNIKIALPEFPEAVHGAKPTDWNDLYCLCGKDEWVKQWEEAQKTETKQPAEVDQKETKKQEKLKEAKNVAIQMRQLKDALNQSSLLIHSQPTVTDFYEIVDKEQKIVQLISDETYLKRVIKKKSIEIGLSLPPKKITEAFNSWKLSAPGLTEMPKPFIWKSQNEWALHKLPFDPEEGKFPAWDSFLNRLSGRNEFMAYVWSIFEPKNKSRQYLWIYGARGEEGKSTTIKAIARLLGKAAGAINNSQVNDSAKWLPAMLYGKRLAVWPDCKNSRFTMSEILRNLTSGDPVPVERKGEMPFMAEMRVKLMIASNQEPEMTGQGANLSRLIRIDIEPNTNPYQYEWEDLLQTEMPYFLFACREKYEELCPGHGEIKVTQETKQLSTDSCNAMDTEYDDIYSKFEYGRDCFISSSELNTKLKDMRLNRNQIIEIKKEILKKEGVRFGQDNHGIRTYFGIQIINELSKGDAWEPPCY